MIINPSKLFPEHASKIWKYVPVINYDFQYFNVLCNHKRIQFLWEEQLFTQVTLKAEKLINGKESCIIWFGKCQQCYKILWACKTFDWMKWLTDTEAFQTITRQLGIVCFADNDLFTIPLQSFALEQ